MSQVFHDLKLGLDEDLEEKLARLVPEFSDYRIKRQSVDARRSRKAHFVVSVEVFEKGETPPQENYELEKVKKAPQPPIVVGSGPAGLFAAVRLCERGIPCILLERGSDAVTRLKAINRFWRYGEFQDNNNVCFGEGGAGLYSDGKLITRIKSPHIKYVMNRLVQFGAPAEIEYLANPHVGSDRIRKTIPKIREHIRSLGGQILFDHKVSDFTVENNSIKGVICENGKKFESDHVILATGHSAQDIFDLLNKHEVFMEPKSFAMGLRIEHPQKLINRLQYREAAEHPKLGAANYKITHHNKETGIGVYSFCMCPGGYTISSGTEADGIVSNGMSNYNRNSPFANSAMVVTLDAEKWFGDNLFAGLNYRRELEKGALKLVQEAGGKKQLPAQNVVDFLERKSGDVIKTSSPSGAAPARLDQFLPEGIYEPLTEALRYFEKKMPGFISRDVQLFGIESRTSCPVRVTRDKTSYQSLSHQGLYPTGEGAGYAGGITSAAVDGIRVAEAIVDEYLS